MSKIEVYFVNHHRPNKFPWSIYHAPLLNGLEKFLKSINGIESKHVLVVGPGDLQEIDMLIDLGFRISVADIDQRTLQFLKSKNYPIENYYLVTSGYKGYPDLKFDAIYAKEVIEHIVDDQIFLSKMYELLKANGRLWLSTPNYGFFLLPLLEVTILELIARLSGFSRLGIHPNKFNVSKLEEHLHDAGFKQINSEITFLRLAIWSTGGKLDSSN